MENKEEKVLYKGEEMSPQEFVERMEIDTKKKERNAESIARQKLEKKQEEAERRKAFVDAIVPTEEDRRPDNYGPGSDQQEYQPDMSMYQVNMPFDVQEGPNLQLMPAEYTQPTQPTMSSEYRIGGLMSLMDDDKIKSFKDGGKKVKEISDPKEYAYRKKMYDDSLSVYNYNNKMNKQHQASQVNQLKKLEGKYRKHLLPEKIFEIVPNTIKTKSISGKGNLLAFDANSHDFGLDFQRKNGYKFNGEDGYRSYIAPIGYELRKNSYIEQWPIIKDDSFLGIAYSSTANEKKHLNNLYRTYKKPTQPVKYVPVRVEDKKTKTTPKQITTKVNPKVIENKKVENKPVITPKVDPKAVESKINTPKGYQPYSIYGRKLDPEVYGYGESIDNKPIEVAQFADTYGLKEKMEGYKKSGKYPWSDSFRDGGLFSKLTSDENISKYKKSNKK